MPHVDEGTLHAYLDGALEEYPPAEAKRVREHLDACAECRDRLSDERLLREAVTAILEVAVPPVEAPTFEDLRAYVGAHPALRSRASLRLSRFGWAASVALALGIGWVLRGGGPVREAALVDEIAPARPEAASAPLGPTVTPPVVARTAPPVDEPAVQTVAAPPVPEEPSILLPALETGDLVAELVVVPTIEDVAPLSAPEVDAAAVRDTSSRVVIVQLDDPAGDPEDARPERRGSSVDVIASAQSTTSSTGLTGGRIGRGDAGDEPVVDDDSYSLVVPGLTVLDVRFRGDGTRPEGQVALQLLASGDTLQVIHLPPELDPGSLDPRASGINELVVQRSAGWIVMRARLADAQLMELMTRLLAGS